MKRGRVIARDINRKVEKVIDNISTRTNSEEERQFATSAREPMDITEVTQLHAPRKTKASTAWFGEVININLLNHADTGKSRGFCFLCYQDQRSIVLAVDKFNAITVSGRTVFESKPLHNVVRFVALLKRVMRVDHVEQYKVPEHKKNATEQTK
ncbi:unnamed protein product [Angiostrongylus costaricensis]|uniref:RRM domain-containing protein n=1 Tax=Angiostrongylus costaricensis TaxID=334426 RepID=A0A0R3PJZ5_ANGCS|nr:unnamed protein product [Angiostrongylus costaricensis]